MSSGTESSGGDLIDISDLSKVFVAGDVETHALSAVSLTVKRGEYVSIEGPSGSGNPPCSPSLVCSMCPARGRIV
jgi:ABC-type dipeptide/oligopeptide/nickel transport system ATPase subunit